MVLHIHLKQLTSTLTQALATDTAGAFHHLHAMSPRKKLKIPTMAEPAPSTVRSHHIDPMIRSSMRPVYRFSVARGSGIGVYDEGNRSIGGAHVSGDDAVVGDGSSSRQTTGLWSDVTYDGIDVYKMLVMLDFSGVSGESV